MTLSPSEPKTSFSVARLPKYKRDTSISNHHMNQKPKITNPNDFQLRLLIPREWVEELDVLAKAKYKSRLALIREYLRAAINRDFIELNEFHSNRQNVRQARAKTEAWCRELESRKRNDQW